jgi:hypothetical protein
VVRGDLRDRDRDRGRGTPGDGDPALIGPALLTLAFYLWDAFHGAAPSRRRDPRWIWQTGCSSRSGVIVIGWNLAASER